MEFVRSFVDVSVGVTGLPPPPPVHGDAGAGAGADQLMEKWMVNVDHAISLRSLGQLLSYPDAFTELLQASLVLVMTILRGLPLLSRAITDADTSFTDRPSIPLLLGKEPFAAVLAGLMHVMSTGNEELYSFASESVSALLSTLDSYFNADKVADVRLESISDRKTRLYDEAARLTRSKQHTQWALSKDLLPLLVRHLDHDSSSIRLHAASCLGKIAHGTTHSSIPHYTHYTHYTHHTHYTHYILENHTLQLYVRISNTSANGRRVVTYLKLHHKLICTPQALLRVTVLDQVCIVRCLYTILHTILHYTYFTH